MEMACIAPRDFRDALGHYASGLTVVAGVADGTPVGFTCQSFHSASLDPPLVSFGVGVGSTSYPLLRADGRFAVNVLAGDQLGLVHQFARSGTDKWAGVEWTPARNGTPVIRGVVMWVAGRIHAEYPAGDHTIVIGEVEELGPVPPPDTGPLLFHRGRLSALRER